MPRSLLLGCIAAALLQLPTAEAAGEQSLLQFDLRSLSAPETHSLERYRGKPVLLVFFQPECSWCLKQFRDINRLQKSCNEGFAPIAIGFRGNRNELRKELRRLRPEFPAYQATPRILAALGNFDTTPYSFLGDSDGNYVNWLRGYMPSDDLQSFIAAAGELDCS